MNYNNSYNFNGYPRPSGNNSQAPINPVTPATKGSLLDKGTGGGGAFSQNWTETSPATKSTGAGNASSYAERLYNDSKVGEGAGGGQLASSAISAGVQAAGNLIGGALQNAQTEELRNQAYEEGLDKLFKSKREAERMRRMQAERDEYNKMVNDMEFVMNGIIRQKNKRQQQQTQLMGMVEGIKQRASSDPLFADQIRQLRNTFGGK